jgi:hypothetical protein
MKLMTRGVMAVVLSVLTGFSLSAAQTTFPDRSPTVDPESGRTIQREQAVGERMPQDRVVVKERVFERRHEGELYVAGFGGYTLGHSFSNVDGTGALAATGIESLDLANSAVYGMKVGYFLPTHRLNWLGFELEGFSSTPHLEQQNGFIGSNLRVSTVAMNVIARKRLGCHERDRHDRTPHATTYNKDGRHYDKDDKDGRHYDKDGRHYYEDDWSPEDENARCPLQVYAGAGPAIFFAQTSNQFGSSGDNGEVGINALAGLKYFMHRNVAVFGEYKFNYAGFDFEQYGTPATGNGGGITGNYKASHFVGGLAVHF